MAGPAGEHPGRFPGRLWSDQPDHLQMARNSASSDQCNDRLHYPNGDCGAAGGRIRRSLEREADDDYQRLVRAVLILGLAFVTRLEQIYVIFFLVSTVSSFFGPSQLVRCGPWCR